MDSMLIRTPVMWLGCITFALAVAGALAGPGLAQSRSTEIVRIVRDHAAANDFSGTILVDQAGDALAFESFGQAERAFEAPATNTTRYRIASITKLFTVALVMQLVDEGRVDLHAPAGAYLPGYAGDPGITVHSLLNHTSGLPNPDAALSFEDVLARGQPLYQLPHTAEQLVNEYAAAPLARPVGSAFDYSNADYFVLGRIVEAVTGQTFEAALRARILKPLGLEDTGMLRQRDIVPGLAASYFRMGEGEPLSNDLPVYVENWFAAGAMYSDADDLLVFANAFYDGDLFSRESLARALTPGLEDYGYGLWVWDLETAGRTWHTAVRFGGIMGANAVVYRVHEADLTIIILANTNLVDMGGFARRIAVAALATD